jgi:hypothetical protein
LYGFVRLELLTCSLTGFVCRVSLREVALIACRLKGSGFVKRGVFRQRRPTAPAFITL